VVAVSRLTNIREQLTLMRPFDAQGFLVARGILLAYAPTHPGMGVS